MLCWSFLGSSLFLFSDLGVDTLSEQRFRNDAALRTDPATDERLGPQTEFFYPWRTKVRNYIVVVVACQPPKYLHAFGERAPFLQYG
jgi:hypothetical protein